MSAELKAVKRKLSKLDDPVEVSQRTNPQQSSLCTRCVELRLGEALVDIEPPAERCVSFDVKIADVGQYYRHQRAHGCKLCHMLSASRVTNNQPGKEPEDHDELHVFELWEDLSWVASSPRSDDLLRGHGSLYLVVVPSDFNRDSNWKHLELHGERTGFNVIRRQRTSQPQVFAPQIINPLFDLSLGRYWLQYCKSHHKRLCSMKDQATIDLQLIDCHSLKVIPAPNQADYTALSYVWGVPTTETGPSDSSDTSGSEKRPLPSPMPAIITDAINVTKELGFHYLWVDRYCIDQDSHSKHQQINQMDSIYQNAELTIVAAAGDGPEYGLPGVSFRTRFGQETCTIGDIDIISTMRHPHGKIQSSTWSSRGWTFQEAALSRRALVFTDDQVYFECNAMNCHESFSSDLDLLHVKNKSKFRDVLRAGLFGRSEKQKYGHFDEKNIRPAHNLVRLMGMIEQYTARDLTYDTDSLNAFTGIIRKFETAPKPLSRIFQIWGVPFCRCDSEERTNKSFLDGLAWNHTETGPPSHRAEEPLLQNDGDPSTLQPEQFATSQNQSSMVRQKKVQADLESLQQQQCQQMGKPMPNANGLGGQDSPMVAQAPDGATSSPFYNTEGMAAEPSGAMRVPGGPYKSTKGYNLHGCPRRRPRFPSWSWAGWAGGIQYEARSSHGAPRQLASEVSSIFVETVGAQKVSISTYIDQAEALQTTGPAAIHIQTLALPASAFTYDTSTASPSLQVFNYPARLALSTGPWDTLHFFQSVQNTDQRKCIYIGYVEGMSMIVIMVLEAQDKSWSRVGLIFLGELYYWNFYKSWKEFKMNSKVRESMVSSGDIGEEVTSFRII